jgi:DNA/RNA-binding domain of Phe-tRNA-synthetase-like protein
MKLQISTEILNRYPDLRIGVVVADGVVNNSYAGNLETRCRQVLGDFSNRFRTLDALEKNKNILAWRDIYRSFGANPKKKTPTAEAFLSRVVKSNFVPHISPAVDSYLITEAFHCLPIGGYDMSRISGDITLRFSSGKEQFQGIGSSDFEPTDSGEVLYADSARVLTRRWNYKDCDYAKITPETKQLVLFVEGPLAVIPDDAISQTVDAMASNLREFCKASTKLLFLGKGQDSLQLI